MAEVVRHHEIKLNNNTDQEYSSQRTELDSIFQHQSQSLAVQACQGSETCSSTMDPPTDQSSVSTCDNNSQSEDLTSNETGTSPKSGWMSDILSKLSSWLAVISSSPPSPRDSSLAEPAKNGICNSGEANQQSNPDEEWDDWEWILSKTEEWIMKYSQEKASQIESELQQLRNKSRSLRTKPQFIKRAAEAIDLLTEDQKKDLLVTLDSSKRSKIISDAISSLEREWTRILKDKLFIDEKLSVWKRFKSFYTEQQYEKNLIGSMKEMGWKASHGAPGTGLTAKVLGDIIWCFYKTFTDELRNHIVIDLPTSTEAGQTVPEELEREVSNRLQIIEDMVAMAQTPIINLWIDTTRNIKSITERDAEGKLPIKWRQQELEKAFQRMQHVRRHGADASFLIEKQETKEERGIEREKLKELRKMLEEKLSFRSC
eukprot:GEZU01032879.1.p1 GENE.GEZU01032879.1~~GEZU01032879.1.p1  ORF type:complete len:429 (+),score=107.30 GEZU01032879.1:345-1631(+)